LYGKVEGSMKIVTRRESLNYEPQAQRNTGNPIKG
jgi:hypothetical protein